MRPASRERFPTHADSRVSNSQPAGIGRLTALDSFLIINNLGRNVEIARPSERALEPVATFQDTAFPGEDERSQFDLDMHTFLKSGDGRYLIAANHYGLARFFAYPPALSRPAAGPTDLSPKTELWWKGDSERLIIAGSCLISTSPRGYAVPDAAEPGVLISAPFTDLVREAVSNPGDPRPARRLAYEPCLTDWGQTTAIALDAQARRLAVAAGSRLGLFSLCQRQSGAVRLDKALWEISAPFATSWIELSADGSLLYAAGCDLACQQIDDGNWDALFGGGFLCLSTTDARVKLETAFEPDLAWGSGGVPLALSEEDKLIWGVDRCAGLHAWSLRTGTEIPLAATARQSSQRLGIAHLTKLGDKLYCGFNRGGYQLHCYTVGR